MSPRHTWHIVSGKGGTGKTTIAGALACALATSGRRVLVCEVEGRQGISQLFDVPPLSGAEERRICRTPSGGMVYGLAIDAEDALIEYLDTFYHLSIAGRALDRFGAVDFATSIAPGLRDVLLTGKVYEAVRRKIKTRPNAYDAVVLDAPPTGRIAQFLNVHAAVVGLAKVGPIRNQADSIMRLLRSATTTVHLVTLLEDMPVTETEEAVAALRPTQIRIGTVIENMVTPTPLSRDRLQHAAAGSVILKVPGLTTKQNQALASEFAIEAARTLQEQQRHDRLTALGLPLVQIAFDHEGVDEGSIFAIAEQLTDQMSLEAA
ncbi:MAG TPA: ArsA-related P-loop ATPase [Propionibacteriaceae bacterium]|nr:ArsA-related P-loop ATPase [Propionibacteriaceae bacterium]